MGSWRFLCVCFSRPLVLQNNQGCHRHCCRSWDNKRQTGNVSDESSVYWTLDWHLTMMQTKTSTLLSWCHHLVPFWLNLGSNQPGSKLLMFNNVVIDCDDHVVKYVKSILFISVSLEKTQKGEVCCQHDCYKRPDLTKQQHFFID